MRVSIQSSERSKKGWLALALAVVLILGVTALFWPIRECGTTVGWREPSDVVLLCRGTDPIRIWPWPVVQPWSEDGGQTWVEEIAAVYR